MLGLRYRALGSRVTDLSVEHYHIHLFNGMLTLMKRRESLYRDTDNIGLQMTAEPVGFLCIPYPLPTLLGAFGEHV